MSGDLGEEKGGNDVGQKEGEERVKVKEIVRGEKW